LTVCGDTTPGLISAVATDFAVGWRRRSDSDLPGAGRRPQLSLAA